MTLKEMREKSARAIAEARSLIDALKTDSTAEARAEAHRQADAFLTEAQGYDGQIATLERLEAAEQRAASQRADQRPIIAAVQNEQRRENGNEADEYRDAFFALLAVGGAAQELEPEQRAVLKRGYQALAEKRAQTTTGGSGAAGGYLIPQGMGSSVDIAMLAYGPMYNKDIVTVINTPTGNTIPLPTADDTGSTGGTHTEGADLLNTGSKKQLDAFMYDTVDWLRISLELATDSAFALEPLIKDFLSERLGRLANTKLTTGTGTGEPNGIVTGSTAGKTTASTTAFTADEILDFYHSVNSAYRASPKARFMLSDPTLLAVRKLKDGQGNYLVRNTVDMAGKLVINDVAVPYSINDSMANAGATGNKFMLFGDFSKYYVRKVGGIVVGVVRERFWPDSGLAGYVRLDGEIINTAAIKHMKHA